MWITNHGIEKHRKLELSKQRVYYQQYHFVNAKKSLTKPYFYRIIFVKQANSTNIIIKNEVS